MQEIKVFYCYDEEVCDKLFRKLQEKKLVVTRTNNNILTDKQNYLKVLSVGECIIKEEGISHNTSAFDINGSPIILNFLKVMKCTTSEKTSYTWEVLNDDTVVPPNVLAYVKELESALKRKVCFKYNNLDGSIDIFVKGHVGELKSIIDAYLPFQKENPFVWDKVYFYDKYGVLAPKQYNSKEALVNLISYFERSFATESCLLTEYERSKVVKPDPSTYGHLIQYKEIVASEMTVEAEGEYMSPVTQKEIPFHTIIKNENGIIYLKTNLENDSVEINETFIHSGLTLIHNCYGYGTESFMIPRDFAIEDGLKNLKIILYEPSIATNNYTLTRKK